MVTANGAAEGCGGRGLGPGGSGNLVSKAGMGWLLVSKIVWRDQHLFLLLRVIYIFGYVMFLFIFVGYKCLYSAIKYINNIIRNTQN